MQKLAELRMEVKGYEQGEGFSNSKWKAQF